MALPRPRLSLADWAHRGVNLGLVGISMWALFTGYQVHQDTLRRGRGVPFSRFVLNF